MRSSSSITAPGAGIAFRDLLAHEITSLMAFRLRCQGAELSFTLDLELDGAPPDRDLEILRATVKNRDSFVRYLQLLLGDWQPFGDGGGKRRKGNGAGASADDTVPLFELMVRSLAHDPARLGNIAQVVERLQQEVERLHEHVAFLEQLLESRAETNLLTESTPDR